MSSAPAVESHDDGAAHHDRKEKKPKKDKATRMKEKEAELAQQVTQHLTAAPQTSHLTPTPDTTQSSSRALTSLTPLCLTRFAGQAARNAVRIENGGVDEKGHCAATRRSAHSLPSHPLSTHPATALRVVCCHAGCDCQTAATAI